MKLLISNSHPGLGGQLAKEIGISPVNRKAFQFSNTEVGVEINENIRGERVYILGTGSFDDSNCRSVNDSLMETLVMVDACRRSNTASVTLILPYYPYCRQDKKDAPRVPITAKLVADMLEGAGVGRIITMDLHASQIQGFFGGPCDNLYAINLMCDYIKSRVFGNLSFEKILSQYILISPDNGGAKRVNAYSRKLGINNVIMHKQRDYSQPSKVEKCILVGDHSLKGRTGIIIDDMCDTMGTMVKASETLMELGIKDVIVVATHGIFSGPAIERINGCAHISRVIVTDSLPQKGGSPKIEVVSLAPFLAEVVRRIETGESLSALF